MLAPCTGRAALRGSIPPVRTIYGAAPLPRSPVPGARRAWWLQEALAAEGDPPPAAPLHGDATADVVIVGGGYTGLSAALTSRG